jgi:hypothetical protein
MPVKTQPRPAIVGHQQKDETSTDKRYTLPSKRPWLANPEQQWYKSLLISPFQRSNIVSHALFE